MSEITINQRKEHTPSNTQEKWAKNLEIFGSFCYFQQRNIFIRNHKKRKNGVTEYALKFLEDNKDKLSELDLVDLSALIRDLRAGTFGPRRDEYIDAIETVVSIAAKKMPSRKDMEEDNEKYGIADVESSLYIISIYEKTVKRKLPSKLYAKKKSLTKLMEKRKNHHTDKQTKTEETIEPEVQIESENTQVSKEQKYIGFDDAIAKACGEEQIKFEKNEDKNTSKREYNLWNPREQEKPTGKLTVYDEHNVDMQSEEYAHFKMLAIAAKESGASFLAIGKLSDNEEEAKKFVALLLLAGAEVGLQVVGKHEFDKQDLIKVVPEFAKHEDMIKARAINEQRISQAKSNDKTKQTNEQKRTQSGGNPQNKNGLPLRQKTK